MKKAIRKTVKKLRVKSIDFLNSNEMIQEFFMMGLRLKEGVNLENLKRITDKDVRSILCEKALKYYAKLDLLTFNEKRIALTDKGLILHSYLVPRLFILR